MSDITYDMISRAEYARDLEYIKEDTEDYGMDDRLDRICQTPDTTDDFEVSRALVDKMPAADNTRETEVERLLRADRDMTFDDMIGLNDNQIDPNQNINPCNSDECGGTCCGPSSTVSEEDDGTDTSKSDESSGETMNSSDTVSKEANSQASSTPMVEAEIRVSPHTLSGILEFGDTTDDVHEMFGNNPFTMRDGSEIFGDIRVSYESGKVSEVEIFRGGETKLMLEGVDLMPMDVSMTQKFISDFDPNCIMSNDVVQSDLYGITATNKSISIKS